MATNYSLICWGGSSGRTFTVTIANPAVVTFAANNGSTNHGLYDGTAIDITTSGALPTGLAAGTYYTRSASTNTAHLYDTYAHAIAGGSTGRVATSGSQSGTHTAKSNYYNTLSSTSRWGSLIYDGLHSWRTARTGSTTQYDTEVAEIGMAWTEYWPASTSLVLDMPCIAHRIETMINGISTAGYHGGSTTGGYNAYVSTAFWVAFDYNRINCTVDGVRVTLPLNDQVAFNLPTGTIPNGSINAVVKYCVVVGNTGSYNQIGILHRSEFGAQIHHNFLHGVTSTSGSRAAIYARSNGGKLAYVYQNTVTGGDRGIFGDASVDGGYWLDNLSLGNTTNWGTKPTGLTLASNNGGDPTSSYSKGTPWDSASNYVGVNTTDITSNAVPTAVSTSSPQVRTGASVYQGASYDITKTQEDPAYYNGGAEIRDIGAFTKDQGFGNHPSDVTVAVSGLVTSSRMKIVRNSDSTSLYNDVVGGSSVSFSQTVQGDTGVTIYIRKGSAAPFYHEYSTTATISSTAGLTLTANQIADIAAASYAAGVATDFTYNYTTKVFAHASGSTVYKVQDLYSWHMDDADSSTNIDKTVGMYGVTPSQFTLINGASISDADTHYLKSGSIDDGTNLWSCLYTIGSLSGSPTLYVVQNGSKITGWWGAGHIDILQNVKSGGTLIDSGNATVFARKWGYTYAHATVDLSGGGKNPGSLTTLADGAITQSTGTVGGWTDVTVTFGTISRDLGDGAGPQTYKCEIDCNGRPLSEVYQRMQYLCREDSSDTLNGVSGWRYLAADSSYTANTSAPFGNYSGGFWTVAQGVWLKNIDSADTYSYQLTDHSGGTHQLVQSENQTVTVSGATSGSRIQIYDVTSSTELYNGTPSFPYTWSDPDPAVATREIRLRVSYQSGATAKVFIDQTIGTCALSGSGKDVSYLVSQSDDDVYIANAVDGSTVTGMTITDAAFLLSVSSGSVTTIGGVDVIEVAAKDMYAYETYWLFTEAGIRDEGRFIDAVDQANYLFNLFKIKNTTTGPTYPVVIVGGYVRDAATNSAASLVDYSGGPIFFAPDHVVNNIVTVGGVNIITGDIADIATAAENAAAVWTRILENSLTAEEIVRIIAAVLAGKVSGAGSATEVFKGLDGVTDRVTSTVDSSGNRTAVAVDGA